jgi:hypothetical protein
LTLVLIRAIDLSVRRKTFKDHESASARRSVIWLPALPQSALWLWRPLKCILMSITHFTAFECNRALPFTIMKPRLPVIRSLQSSIEKKEKSYLS